MNSSIHSRETSVNTVYMWLCISGDSWKITKNKYLNFLCDYDIYTINIDLYYVFSLFFTMCLMFSMMHTSCIAFFMIAPWVCYVSLSIHFSLIFTASLLEQSLIPRLSCWCQQLSCRTVKGNPKYIWYTLYSPIKANPLGISLNVILGWQDQLEVREIVMLY